MAGNDFTEVRAMLNISHGFIPSPEHLLCQNGSRLSGSIAMKVVLVLKILACLAGIFIWCVFYKVKPQHIIQHINCRLLLRYNALATFLNSVVVLVITTWDLIRLSFPINSTNGCDHLLDRRTAEIVHAIAFTVMFSIVLSSTLICLERTWCTMHLHTYENSSAKYFVLGVLFLMTLAISLIFYFFNLHRNENWEIPKLGFTTKGLLNNYPTEYIIIVAFSIEFVTFIILRIVYFFNKLRHYRIRQDPASVIGNGPSLSSKFQIKENISVTITWGYILTTHFFIMLISFPAIIFVMRFNDDAVITVILCEAFNWMTLHGIAMPLIIMKRYPTLLWRALELFRRKKIDAARAKVTPVDCQGDTKLYFCHLRELFNGKNEEPSLFSFCI